MNNRIVLVLGKSKHQLVDFFLIVGHFRSKVLFQTILEGVKSFISLVGPDHRTVVMISVVMTNGTAIPSIVISLSDGFIFLVSLRLSLLGVTRTSEARAVLGAHVHVNYLLGESIKVVGHLGDLISDRIQMIFLSWFDISGTVWQGQIFDHLIVLDAEVTCLDQLLLGERAQRQQATRYGD